MKKNILDNEFFAGVVALIAVISMMISPDIIWKWHWSTILHLISTIFVYSILAACGYVVINAISIKFMNKKLERLFLVFCILPYCLFQYRYLTNTFRFFKDFPIEIRVAIFLCVIILMCILIVRYKISTRALMIFFVFITSVNIYDNDYKALKWIFSDGTMWESSQKAIVPPALAKSDSKVPNVYYIIYDEMTSLKLAQEMSAQKGNIFIDEEAEEKKLKQIGLRYIPESKSTSEFTATSIRDFFHIRYIQNSANINYITSQVWDETFLFPFFLYNDYVSVPFLSNVKNAGSSSYWISNYSSRCSQSKKMTCGGFNWIDDFIMDVIYISRATPLRRLYNYNPQMLKKYTMVSDVFVDDFQRQGGYQSPYFIFIHNLVPHRPYVMKSDCQLKLPSYEMLDKEVGQYVDSYACSLKKIAEFMTFISKHDPDAIVAIGGDHGYRVWHNLHTKKKEKALSIFNAIKAPDHCFDKYGAPSTLAHISRFLLNCAYNYNYAYTNTENR